MNNYMQDLADNLKDLMGDMTVSELSRKVGISQPTLSRYLLCQRRITVDNLIKLSNFFNVDMDILVGRKDY